MTAKEIEIDRKIAYNKRKSAQMINLFLCIIAIIGIILVNCLWPDETLHGTNVLSAKPDTIYTYYRGEQGYIRFHKPADFSPIYDHSEIVKPIEP